MIKPDTILQQLKDPPIIVVIVVLALLLVYGGISLIVDPKPDPVTFNEQEQRLSPEEWIKLYESKKQQQDEQEQKSIYRFFEFGDKK